MAVFVLRYVLLLLSLRATVRLSEAKAFADTCACPDAVSCPLFCVSCNTLDTECTSGKTNGYCNGEDNEDCPDIGEQGYFKMGQKEVNPNGGVWWCSSSYGRRKMYHCHRLCLDITTGRCDQCQDGYYATADNTTCSACPAGSWCKDGHIQGDSPAGYYTEGAATAPEDNQCLAGYFGSTPGQTSETCSGKCDAGYWCGPGSTTATENKCLAGRWGKAGESNPSCTGPCTAGYYCPEASYSATQNPCGNVTVYCPEGSSTPLTVDSGFYSSPLEIAEDTRTGQTVAPKGHYADSGALYPCPAGTFSNSLGATSCTDNICSAGFYCPEGSISATARECYPGTEPPAHPAEYYCVAGTSVPTQVLPGYYTIPEDGPESQREGQELADPTLYTVKYGIRHRKVEWRGECAGDNATLSITEFTNDGDGDGIAGSLVLELVAYDNVNDMPISSFEILPGTSAAPGCNGDLPFYKNGTRVEIKPNSTLDYELCSTYDFFIVAEDANSTNSATCSVTLNVVNLNDKPYFRAGDNYPYDQPLNNMFYVKERSEPNEGVGQPIQTFDEEETQEKIYEIMDTLDGPEDLFYIGGCSGQLYVQRDTLDYAVKRVYHLQIRACDDPKVFDETVGKCTVPGNVTINVEDVNDPPYFNTSIVEFRIAENSAADTILEPYCNSPNATEGLIRCWDLDGLVVEDLDFGFNRSSTTDVITYSILQDENEAFDVVSCLRSNNLDLCDGLTPGMLQLRSGIHLNYEVKNSYFIKVRANDGRGGEDIIDVAITVTDENDPPIWVDSTGSAGRDITLFFQEETGMNSGELWAIDEDESDILTYTVVYVENATGASFETSNGNNASALQGVPILLESSSVFDYEERKYYTVVVQVSDGQAAVNKSILVEITDINEQPIITTTMLSVLENVNLGTALDTRIASSDPDNRNAMLQSAYFSRVSSSPGRFSVGISGDVFVQDLLNYEEIQNHTLVAKVDDGFGLTSTAVITIIVIDAPEPPEITEGQSFIINETTTFADGWTRPISYTDEDFGDSVTFQILSQTDDETGEYLFFFDVSGSSLVINSSHPEAVNYELNSRIALTIQATDSYNLSATEQMFINVQDINDRPVLLGAHFGISKHTNNSVACNNEYCMPGLTVFALNEYCSDDDVADDSLATDITYSIISGNVDNTFEISNAELKVARITTGLETAGFVFNLTIQALDQHPVNPLATTANFTVEVTPQNFRPVGVDHNVTISEGFNTTYPYALIPDLGATDPEDTVLVYTIVGIQPSAASPAFSVDGPQLSVLQELDYESMATNGLIELVLRVRDSGGSANAQSTTFIVKINVLDVNEPPSFQASSYEFSLYELASQGPIPSATIVAYDEDLADVGQLRYHLAGDDSLFNISATTAQIYLNGELDFESPKAPLCSLSSGLHRCSLVVVVEDTAGNNATVNVIVNVRNVNEKPVFTGVECVSGRSECMSSPFNVTIPEDTILDQKILSFLGSDPDFFDSMTFTFLNGSSTDVDFTELEEFQLGENGNLYLTSPVDFENKSQYDLDVLVTDQGGLTDLVSLHVIVTNINDIGKMLVNPNEPLPTQGGAKVVLVSEGVDIGPTDYKIAMEGVTYPSVRAFLGTESALLSFNAEYEASGCFMNSSQTVVCLSSPPGVGKDLYWRILVGGIDYSELNLGVVGQSVRYKEPRILAVMNATAIPTRGGTMFSLIGEDFGSDPTASFSVIYRSRAFNNENAYTATGCVLYNATRIDCISSEGVGGELEFQVSVQGQASEWFTGADMKYANPSITGVRLVSGSSAMSTLGSTTDRLVLSGANFGTLSFGQQFGVTVFYGTAASPYLYTANACNITESHIEIRCFYVEGTGTALTFSVVVGAQVSSSSSMTLSYIGPSIFWLDGPGATNARTKGGDLINIHGEGFGPVTSTGIEAYYGGRNATEYQAYGCSVETKDTLISCTTVAGTGFGHAWKVLVAGQESPVSLGTEGLGTSYAPPTLNYFEGMVEDANTVGGELIYIVGLDFGDGTSDVNATFGPTGVEYTARDCLVDPFNLHTRIQCTLPRGVGDKHKWVVSVDGQDSRVPTTDYKEPEIVNITGAISNASTIGGGVIMLQGFNFGPRVIHEANKQFRVLYGQKYEAANCSILADEPSEMECLLAPGVGRDLQVRIEVAGQVSAPSTDTVSYGAPIVERFSPVVGRTSTNFQLTIRGHNFGEYGDASVFLNSDLSLNVISQNHTMIVVAVPEPNQRNSNNEIKVAAGGQEDSSLYSFGRPVVESISAVEPPRVVTGPPQQILIRGYNFGIRDASSDFVMVNNSECIIDEWAHDFISCNLTSLVGDMVITVGQQTCMLGNGTDSIVESGCCPCDFDYNELLKPPKLTSISRCGAFDSASTGCPTNGGYALTVYGSNLGTHINGWVSIDGKVCDVVGGVANYSEFEITCTVPPGEGIVQVYVHHAWKRSQETVYFYYDIPRISSFIPMRGSTPGGYPLTITGHNFGTNGPTLFFGGMNTTWQSFSHNSIVFNVPEGQGLADIFVEVDGQVNLDPVTFDYYLPNVTSASPLTGATYGGYNITLYGTDFGLNGTVFIGPRVCFVLEYSHSQIVCSLPPGTGQTNAVRVRSAGRYSVLPVPIFAYDLPNVTDVSPLGGTTRGGTVLTVLGDNFGNVASDIVVTIGGLPCSIINVTVPHKRFLCSTSPGVGENHAVVVNISEQVAPANFTFDYDAPIATSYTPSPFDSIGGLLTIYGDNFGSEASDPGAPGLSVDFADYECSEPSRADDMELTCNMSAIPVGNYSLSLAAAGQYLVTAVSFFLSACRAGFYGQQDEYCRVCPEGAFCLGYQDGYHHEPINIDGWGRVDRHTFVRCEPEEACLQRFRCKLGYEHVGDLLVCGGCSDNYYRLEGLCHKCPSYAWLILIGCVLGASLLCAYAYFLTKYGVQLAAVTIAIDFCQIVALFTKYDFNWPSIVSEAYLLLSVFNLNLDIASPKCTLDFGYIEKWYIMFLSPVAFAFIFTINFIYNFTKRAIYKVFQKSKQVGDAIVRRGTRAKLTSKAVVPIKDNSDKDTRETEFVAKNEEERKLLVEDGDMESYDEAFNRFIDAQFGAFMIMCYYLYLSVMRRCFEIFQCGGPGGTLEAETSITCSEDNPEFTTLRGFARLGLVIYGVGIPGSVAYLLFKHRRFIKKDQLRRERALSKDQSQAATKLQSAWRTYYVRRIIDPTAILKRHIELGNIGRTRAKFGKLYEDFNGRCYYWRLVLLLRKLLLVLIALFVENKYQKTTLAFGVLFTAYTLQVFNKPYLSRYKTNPKRVAAIKAYKAWQDAQQFKQDEKKLTKMHKMLRKVRKVKRKEDVDMSEMDMKLLTINENAVVNLDEAVRKRERVISPDRPLHPSERRWLKIQTFVNSTSRQKFRLRAEFTKALAEDTFQWLLDYNTLEALSLAASMFVLLFGLLFDTLDEESDPLAINLLAGVTIFIFCMVLSVFWGSVYLDVYKKFFPAMYRRIFVPVVLRLLKCCPAFIRSLVGKIPTKEELLVSEQPTLHKSSLKREIAKRGQWISPVNPFATLGEQNANLVKAEEARIAAIMRSKERHAAELRERELKREQEKQRVQEEYRLRLEEVDAEIRAAEESELEEEALIQAEIEKEIQAKEGEINAELKEKLASIENGGETLDVDGAEDSLDVVREAEFQAESELLSAEVSAEAQEKLVELKENQLSELEKVMGELEKQAEEVFSGHRQQQEEIKARLQERKVRKVTRKRKKPEETTDPEMEKMMQQLEDRLGSVISNHDSAVEQLKVQLEEHRVAKLEDLKAQVRDRVLKEHEQDIMATQKDVENIEAFDEETAKQMNKLTSDFEAKTKELEASGASNDQVDQLKAEMNTALEEFKSKRLTDRATYLAKIQEHQAKRIEEIKAKEAAEENQRMEKLAQAKRKEMEQKLRLEEIQAKERDANENELADIRAEFKEHSNALNDKLEEEKSKRRELLEKRIVARRNALTKAADVKPGKDETQIEGQDDKDEAVVQARLAKLKDEAKRQREALEANLKQSKQTQRAKLLERQRKRKAAAMEKKQKVLQEKEKEEEEVERKLREEEQELRKKQQEEIEEIEKARIEVFLEEAQAKNLAAGVQEWRERQKKMKESKANQGPKRSDLLKADFESKASQLEHLLQNRNPEETEEEKEKTAKLIQKKQKELETLVRSYEEEIDAELSRMSNEAAIEKARHARKMKTLFSETSKVTLPGSTGGNEAEPEQKMFVNLDKLDL